MEGGNHYSKSDGTFLRGSLLHQFATCQPIILTNSSEFLQPLDIKNFKRGNPFESPARPTVHNPDSDKDAVPKNVLPDPPRLSIHTPSKMGAMGTFQQTTKEEMPQRWTWWQIISGQKDAAEDTKGRGWKAAPFVFVGEFGERAASFGLQMSIIYYFLYEMHMPLVSATNLSTNFFGASSLATFGGAFLADAYLGRFLTFAIGEVFYILGLVVFTMSAAMKALRPQPCTQQQLLGYALPKCQEASALQMGVIYISLVLQCLGSGGVRPCGAPFGADQFDRSSKKHTDQLRHYWNWYYMSIVSALVLAGTLFIYIMDDVSWGWGGAAAAVLMALSAVIFLFGTRYYIYLPPYGSPVTRMVQVVVAAMRKRKHSLPKDPDSLYHDGKFLDKESLDITQEVLVHTDQFRFLDKAAILEEINEEPDVRRRFHPWRLATVNQVEELKQLLKILPVWLSTVIVSTVMIQSYTLTFEQSSTMNRRLGTFTIPAASMPIFSYLTLIGFIPFYGLVLIQMLRKFTGDPKGLSYLQRIGVGTFLNVLVMVAAACVEAKRRKVAHQQPAGSYVPGSTLPISAFWLLIPLVLAGFTESFVFIGQLEFFYDEAPKSIKSMSNAFMWASVGLGGFLSSGLVSLTQGATSTKGLPTGESGWLQTDINRGHLDYFYWVLALLSLLNFLYFLLVSYWYKYKKTSLDDTSSNDNFLPIM